MDTLWLGGSGDDDYDEEDSSSLIRIDHQVFAQVTRLVNFATCEEEEGILGLSNSRTTSHQFPSLINNLLHFPTLAHNLFGMYLQAQDDYPSPTTMGVFNQDDTTMQQRTASSQLVLGGVDQTHYLGCLKWHELDISSKSVDTTNTVNGNNNRNSNHGFDDDYNQHTASTNSGNDDNAGVATTVKIEPSYWTLALDAVKVGGTSLTQTNTGDNNLVAVLDSGSSYLVGPQAQVAHLVQLNHAKCFTMENFNGASPQQVACDDPNGFDGAILSSCDDPFFNLQFVIGQETYVLEKEDLMVTVDTLFGEACILRIVGAEGMQVSL